MTPIDAIKDPRIATARSLATRAGRDAAGLCLVEGPSLIRQARAAGARLAYVLTSVDSAGDDPSLHEELRDARVPVHTVRAGLLRKVTGGAKPVGWLAVAHLPAPLQHTDPYGDFAVVCERVADPGNLGTIVRTARALGVRDVVLTDGTTDLSSRRAIDASRGTVLDCRTRRFADPATAVTALREAGFQIVVTSPRGTHLQAMAPLRGQRLALVVGNETEGVSDTVQALADLVVQIPMAGAVESLNVGVATGISIYELRMRMILTMLTDRIRDSLGRNLGAAAHLVRQVFDAELRRIGDLDSAQAVLLMVLACEERTPLEQLRRDIGVGPTEVREAVAPLLDRGYVAVAADDAADLTITAEGKQAIAALWAVQERTEEALYAGFSATERDQLQGLLRRVQDNALRLARRAGD
ncbi:TrmH family RNA methyltransferase [Streptomyces noursei]|uniref:TrmH family RNA methyltransferase n=1 Tax=Streptomyces noursei TaxID=1971 RepID=UPI000C9C6D03|nr:TrmH family RNA methyltransferase [Streptomyces noursei]